MGGRQDVQMASMETTASLPPYDSKKPGVITQAIANAADRFFRSLWLTRFLRAVCPILRIPLIRWTAVTRFDDVAEVMKRSDVFTVPFAGEIARLNDGEAPGTPFILGIDDVARHDKQQRVLLNVFKRDDVARLVTPMSSELAQSIVEGAKDGRLDAIWDLITRVPLELCEKYFGLYIDGDRRKFVDATIDVSKHLFGPPSLFSGPPIIKPEDQSDAAAKYVRAIVDSSISREIRNPRNSDDIILSRLVKPLNNKEITFEEVRAFLLGMLIGSVPTVTIAGGNLFAKLLSRKQFLNAARDAALSGDDDLLRHSLLEAMRFAPHNFCVFRGCSRDFKLAADSGHGKVIKKNNRLIVWTMSAMFDSRRVLDPFKFKPDRPASNYMLFGYGLHWCAGAFIAQALLTQSLKPLLARPQLRKAGKFERRLTFPYRFPVAFSTDGQP